MGFVDRSPPAETSESGGETAEAAGTGSGEDEEQSAGPLSRAKSICTEAVGVAVDGVLDAL
jgi:hypothetical protein